MRVKPFGIDKQNKMSMERFRWVISGINFDELTDKELGFVESCEFRMERKGNLTEDMEKWLENIYIRRKKGNEF